MSKILSYNPANNEIAGENVTTTAVDLENIVKKSHSAFQLWKKTSFSERANIVRKFADILLQHKDEIARLTTQEMGKPFKEAQDDVIWELDFIHWYADNVENILGEKIIHEDDRAFYKTVYEPWGVCASIPPWNYPITMASTGITAQLLAGNTVIFKPSEYTTLTQKLFVDLFNTAGLPDGVLQCVVGAGDVGKMLIDSDINLVWFTGSTKVGQEIYKKCAEKFIPCLLELGGSSPAIVFSDCDIKHTIETIYLARFYNCGQTCSAVKRLFVEKSIYEEFVILLTKKVKSVTIGDPMKTVDLGPLVSSKQLDTLLLQVEDAKKHGAVIEIGGDRPKGIEFEKGNYYLPTILTNVSKNMKVYNEEVFGPVLPIIPFTEEKEVIEMANDTQYGLTAEIFTKDLDKANRMSRQLHAGGISINGDVIYSPNCPIGGFKKSGLGREYGDEGFKELAQLKYICEFK